MSPDLETPSILSMEVVTENEDESEYRLPVYKQVKYLKIAPGTFEQETCAYQILQQHKQAQDLALRFLGHLHKNGRVMGFILEKIDNQKECEMALARFHKFGLHDDVNRYNFLVGKDGKVTLLDSEHFQEDAAADVKVREMRSVRAQLTDESGRGGGFIFGNGED